MTRRIRVLIAAAALLAIAAIAAGCGSSANSSPYSSGSYDSPAARSAPNGAAGAVKIGVGDSALGRILADNMGSTLYVFEKDKGRASTCYGACASVWPPVTIKGKPTAVDGALARMLGSTKRKDGELEVTYNGHPLYRYVGDAQRGDTKGEGLNQFGAGWYVVAPSGNKIDRD
jgi:predicted lipoprotein with Yx(FWY)xxD motif